MKHQCIGLIKIWWVGKWILIIKILLILVIFDSLERGFVSVERSLCATLLNTLFLHPMTGIIFLDWLLEFQFAITFESVAFAIGSE